MPPARPAHNIEQREEVAETADEWDDRIAQMFGGATRSALPQEQAVPPKPGQTGGYL